MDTARWVAEFGAEYNVPGRVLGLVSVGRLVDTSWHNDVCPSFALAGDEERARLFVEHPTPELREDPTAPRFYVASMDETFYSGDDIDAALHVLIPLWWTKNNGEVVDAKYVRARLRRESARWRSFYTADERRAAVERIVNDRTRNGELVGSLVRSFLSVLVAVRAERGEG